MVSLVGWRYACTLETVMSFELGKTAPVLVVSFSCGFGGELQGGFTCN